MLSAYFDPLDNVTMRGREICYTSGLLDQGGCGSCYLAAVTLQIAVTMCNAAWARGGDAVGAPTPWHQISMNSMARIWEATKAKSFCAGGNSNVITNFVQLFWLQKPMSQLSSAVSTVSSVMLTTCEISRSTLTGQCCDPYTMENRNTPNTYFSTNYDKSMNVSYLQTPGQCLSWNNASSYAIDATSMTATSFAYALGETSTLIGTSNYALKKSDTYALKTYLSTIGPLYVTIAASAIDSYPSQWSATVNNVKKYFAYQGTTQTTSTDHAVTIM